MVFSRAYTAFTFLHIMVRGRGEWGGTMKIAVICLSGVLLMLVVLFDYCALVISKGEIHKKRKRKINLTKAKNQRL